MATKKQKTGELGEIFIIKNCICPKCKKEKTLKRLPQNFKCAVLSAIFVVILPKLRPL
jgi:type II restriction enzyme